jgi:hypothetical protein
MLANTSKKSRPWVEGFQPWHLKALNLRQRDEEALSKVDREADGESKSSVLGSAFTGFCEEGIIGCAGIIPVWQGVGHAWVTMGANYKSHRIWIHKQVISHMNKIIAGMDLQRVQANVVCDFTPGVHWLERMGFKLEGKMYKYGPDGSDHYLYARIIE